MSLTDRIKEDLKTSLKGGEQDRTGVLRMILAELQNKSKDKFSKKGESNLDEGEEVEVLRKEFKKRKDAIDLFRKGGREDLALKEELEIKIIKNYLPEGATEEEISKVVNELVSQGLGDFASLMREAMKRLSGRADGKAVGDAVKKKLGGNS